MKTQINLLHDEFVPRFEWVCANHFFALIVLSCCLSFGVYGLAHYWSQGEQQRVADLQTKIDNEQNSINELSQALASRTSDPLLKSKLASLSAQTSGQTRLLNHVRQLSALKKRSFSSLFDALAESHNKQLWLTNFELNTSELNFKGQLSKPKALPVWIAQLSETDFFKGQEFNVASVAREQEKLLFSLTSISPALGNSNASNMLVQSQTVSREVTNEQ